MIICGLKLTHDGTVALLDGDELVLSVEMEKLGNAPRYSAIKNLAVVPRMLAGFGYSVADVGEWVIDGWSDGYSLSRLSDREQVTVALGPYRETATAPDLFRSSVSGTLPVGDRTIAYTSYAHAAGHAAGVYATSPFAARDESSYVLIWDGAMFPRLYLVEPGRGAVGLGVLFPLIGHSYALMAQHFGPFRHGPEPMPFNDLTVAGKLMAYIALGKPREVLLEVLRRAFAERFEDGSQQARVYRAHAGSAAPFIQASLPALREFFQTVGAEAQRMGLPDEDVLASVHQFMQDLLAERITSMLAGRPDGPRNLCFGGGCALNIKWNSALRALPLFDEMWVPPFPNDSGSAIGAATLGRFRREGPGPIRWHTRLGPALGTPADTPQGWSVTPCDAARLARELHVTGSPVIVLHGRAELGPRALGGRSILAAAVSPSMKNELNRIKCREHYRPVAPACLAERAREVFDPGTPDPHMLFEHVVRPDWAHRIPAVVHLDGSARLQTVGPDDDPFLHEVLREYHALSGIPVLCNTSANFNGSGFFPDLDSAVRWGQVDRIWCAGRLYRRVARH
jgi:carbamoyltransferase